MSNGVSGTNFKQWNNTIRFTFLKVTLAARGRLDTYEKSTLGFMLNPHYQCVFFIKSILPLTNDKKESYFQSPSCEELHVEL